MVFLFCSQKIIKKYMEGLTDEELKKESKQESKNEVISTIIRVIVLSLFIFSDIIKH